MICIKTNIKHMPEYCDECQWYETRPHPMKGWSDGCGLMMQCMDDDQPEEWIYDGNGRPKACPLVEVEDEPQTDCKTCRHNGSGWYEKGSLSCERCCGANFEFYEPKDEPQTDCQWK